MLDRKEWCLEDAAGPYFDMAVLDERIKDLEQLVDALRSRVETLEAWNRPIG